MGYPHCIGEKAIEIGLQGKLKVFNFPAHDSSFTAFVDIQQGQAGAIAGGIADGVYVIDIAIREQPQGSGRLFIDIAAESTG